MGFVERLREAPVLYKFEDLQMLPGHARKEPKDIDISTNFTRKIRLQIPLVSAAMDSVTGAEMAIALARRGGIGVLHRNCTPEQELEMVRTVKRAESFIIRDVVTIGKDARVEQARNLMESHKISGLPVVNEAGRLIGIITSRDIRHCSDQSQKVECAMVSKVITANEGITEQDALKLMTISKVEKLPIVDENGRLTGLITNKDVRLRERYKLATRDSEGRLAVAAAVGTGEEDVDRAVMLVKHGNADVLVIDVAHFDSENVIQRTKEIVSKTGKPIVVGNLGTGGGVESAVLKLGADNIAAIKMGMGGGSVCTTTDITSAGSPTPFAIAQAADILCRINKTDIPIIGDGGIRTPGDIAIAFALGASSVMLGGMFAGYKETPGPEEQLNGKIVKSYRGMGSSAARAVRQGIDNRYADPGGKMIEEGREIKVLARGSVDVQISVIVRGIRTTMGYVGATCIPDMAYATIARRSSRAVDIIEGTSGL